MRKIKPLHYNIPQIRAMLADANETYIVAARGTGKSSGIISPWLLRNNQRMPRAQIGIIGATYQQLLVRTLPPVIENWERMGYRRDIHFSIGKPLPKKLATERPLTEPLDWKHAIHWFNGTVNMLISQDRTGTSNGLSLAAVAGDEAKLLNKARYDDETAPTLRGHLNHFGHLSCYQSILFTTDMPTNTDGLWVLDKSEDMNVELVAVIMEMQLLVNKMQAQLIQNESPSVKKTLNIKINKLNKRLNELRQGAQLKDGSRIGTVFYDEASAYDNIDVLGPGFIRKMKRNLSDLKFRTSIKNERITKSTYNFYPMLDESKHGVEWFDYSYLDNLEYDFSSIKNEDSRHDKGYDKSKPLVIGFDYGSNINCLVVSQKVGTEIRFLHSMYVLKPNLLSDLIDKFCKYYDHFPIHHVVYPYDHTALQGHGTTNYTYFDKVMESFAANDWTVTDHYIGQAPNHDRKYELWNDLLRENTPELPEFRYSKTRCKSWKDSADGADMKQGRNGMEKDKSKEKDPKFPQELAPHLSDAGDTIIWYECAHVVAADEVSWPNSTS